MLVRARDLAGRELHEQPAAHVVGAGRDRAGRAAVRAELDPLLVEELLRSDAAQLAVAAVREGAVRGDETVHVVRDALRHADRLQDPLLGELLPGLAGDFLDQLAGDHVEHVVVGECRAEAGRGLQELQPAHGVGAPEVVERHEQQVALALGEAGAVREQVPDRELARDPGVVHAKAGQVVDHLVVPADLAFLDEDGERRAHEGLRRRADLEQRVRVHRLARAELPDAVAARERHLAVLDDGDGGAGHLRGFHDRLDARVEILRRRGEREGRQCGDQDGDEDAHENLRVRSGGGCGGSSREAPDADGEERQQEGRDQQPGEPPIAVRDQGHEAELLRGEDRDDEDGNGAGEALCGREAAAALGEAPAMRSLTACTELTLLCRSAAKIMTWKAPCRSGRPIWRSMKSAGSTSAPMPG